MGGSRSRAPSVWLCLAPGTHCPVLGSCKVTTVLPPRRPPSCPTQVRGTPPLAPHATGLPTALETEALTSQGASYQQ